MDDEHELEQITRQILDHEPDFVTAITEGKSSDIIYISYIYRRGSVALMTHITAAMLSRRLEASGYMHNRVSNSRGSVDVWAAVPPF